MNKKLLIFVVLVVALAAGVAWMLVASRQDTASRQDQLRNAAALTAPQLSQESTPTPSFNEAAQAPANNERKNFVHTITLHTNVGPIAFATYDLDAPHATENFLTLAKKGFYNNLIFHRVIKDFMIQGGDPAGNGTGGPGYEFADELNPDTESYRNGYQRGAVAMANRGPNTNGSQFFIMLKDTPLPHQYTIFGKVISGQDTVDRIGATPTDAQDRPIAPLRIERVTIQ